MISKKDILELRIKNSPVIKREQKASTRSRAGLLSSCLKPCNQDSVSLHLSAPHFSRLTSLSGRWQGGKVASSPSDLGCTSSAAPVGEKGPLFLVVCTEVPGLTRIGLASSTCPGLNPSPEPESVASI